MTDIRPIPAPTTDRSLMATLLIGHLELALLLEQRIEDTGLSAVDALVLRTVPLNRIVTVGLLRSGLALPFSLASDAVGRLVRGGRATLRVHQDDHRLHVVELTDTGRHAVRIVDRASRDLEAEVQSEARTGITSTQLIVEAIEALAWRDRRQRLRSW